MTMRMSKRPVAIVLAAVVSIVLAGCMLMPGKFTSSLDLRRDGSFTFAYLGQIHMLSLSKLARMGEQSTFTPKCLGDGGEERPCSRAEVAEQKAQWQESQTAAAERRKQEAEKMKPLLGGIDASDPRAAEEIAQRLRKQAGWRRVTYRGDGLFDVDFLLTGRLGHDFQFPTIERFSTLGAFVQVAVRNDGTVRIDAPGFGPAPGGSPWRSMMELGAMDDNKPGRPELPVMDGTFTLTTDGEVLANNTDDAPAPDPAGKRLTWQANPRTAAAPMAVIRLPR
jgi:hypothetical protein